MRLQMKNTYHWWTLGQWHDSDGCRGVKLGPLSFCGYWSFEGTWRWVWTWLGGREHNLFPREP